VAVVAVSLSGCRTEYHGYYADIDGVLWRQVAGFKDPLSQGLYRPSTVELMQYLDELGGTRWDGTASSLADLQLEEGGVVLYDISSTDSVADVSFFIASGPRPDVPSEEGFTYTGPSQVFTCYGIEAHFDGEDPHFASRKVFEECPSALVALLPEDAAFASAEVFDG